jgi:hypothetical protein
MLPINNVFNSHTLNPSGCGPEKTKSTLGEIISKEVGIVGQQLKPTKSV